MLPEEMVFEDVAPRLADLDGDGAPEVVVVESHRDNGARLAVWGLADNTPVRLTATPFIGTRFRWLAPVGVADLNGDGTVELAYVDRPHLAKILRVWRYSDGKLTEVTSAAGFTNHKIGERDIAGGIRHCSAGPEMLLASADWQRLLAVRLDGKTLLTRDIGRHEGRASFSAAMECR
ncbi:VCBS repeat-containing protein [Pseudoruegeria sp. M32A2M]|nr:VCBS repeat-containing protein [Pseudoruegeria sp. M32A2M]